MSLAYDLVNSLATSQTEVDDKTLVIDHYTRTIIIPSGIKSLGVENDDDVLRLNFRMPRYLGTVDLYNFKIYVNYINAQGKDDVYEVDDASVVGDDVTFSWQVGPTATAYIGTTSFNVRMTIADADSTIKQEYNTAVARLPVLQGLKCSKRAVSKYSDILAQWERKLFGISDTEEAKLVAASEAQQQHIVDKGNEVLATIPEDYTTTYNLANEGARTKADAIICSAEGEVVAVSDASDDYLRGLTIFGKTTQIKTTGAQVLVQPYRDTTKTLNGVTFTVHDDGSITVLGTNTATDDVSTYFMLRNGSLEAGTYTYSCLGLPGSCVTNIYFIGDVAANSTKTFNAVDGNDYSMLVRVKAKQYVSARIYPMLNRGSTAVDYEPYSAETAAPNPNWPSELISADGHITTEVYGKNLMSVRDITAVGITATVQEDGSLLYKGTSTENAWHVYQDSTFTKSGPYTLTMITSNKTVKGSLVQLYNANNVITQSWQNAEDIQSITFDAESGGKIRWNIGVQLGEVVNTTVKLMLNPGNTPYEWTPYVEKQSITTTVGDLKGIPVPSGGNYTDLDGQQWICDEVDLERGVYVQRIVRLLFNGSENWGLYDYQSNYSGFSLHNALDEIHSRSPGMSNQFHNFKQSVDDGIWVGVGNMSLYAISKEWYGKGLAAWKAHLSAKPLEVIYPRLIPIETPLTADEIAAFKALKSNYPNTTVLNDAGAGMLVRYNADTETWIKNLIDEKIAAAVASLK